MHTYARKQIHIPINAYNSYMYRACVCVQNPLTCLHPFLPVQVYGTLATALTHMGMGTILGFSGITLPQLTDSTSNDLVLSTFQVAIFSKYAGRGG